MDRQLFKLPFRVPSFQSLRTLGVYFAGALYALGVWIFIDAAIYSKFANASDLHVTFVDWIPFLCSSLGNMIVNSIDKSRLMQDEQGLSDHSRLAWQARTVLFLGFSLLAGGIAGSMVVLIVKFLVKGYATYPTVGMGINNVVGNTCILLSCVVLWVAQNVEDEYSYNLSL